MADGRAGGHDAVQVAEEAADVVLEFIEVLCHAVLRIRNVYPAAAFERRKMYGIAVEMSRHPELNEYIHQVLANARTWLLKGLLKAVAVVVLDPGEVVVERYIVQLAALLPAGDAAGAALDDALPKLEDGFRRALTKLGFASFPPAAGGEVTFRLLVLVDDAAAAEVARGGSAQPWLTMEATDVLLPRDAASVQVALGAIRADAVSLNVAAECASGAAAAER